ncbi:MAG: cell division protein ZapA, partial [Bacteroidia bacterium]
MNDEVSIKVKIADRVFPIKVSTSEELFVRRAVKNLDQKIKEIRSQFGIKEYKNLQNLIKSLRGCLNFVFDAEKARFFVQIDTFLSGIAPLRLEKKGKFERKRCF